MMNKAMLNLGQAIERTRRNMYDALYVEKSVNVYEIFESYILTVLDAYVLAEIITDDEKEEIIQKMNEDFWTEYYDTYLSMIDFGNEEH